MIPVFIDYYRISTMEIFFMPFQVLTHVHPVAAHNDLCRHPYSGPKYPSRFLRLRCTRWNFSVVGYQRLHLTSYFHSFCNTILMFVYQRRAFNIFMPWASSYRNSLLPTIGYLVTYRFFHSLYNTIPVFVDYFRLTLMEANFIPSQAFTHIRPTVTA